MSIAKMSESKFNSLKKFNSDEIKDAKTTNHNSYGSVKSYEIVIDEDTSGIELIN